MFSAGQPEDLSQAEGTDFKLEHVAEVLNDGRNFLAELNLFLLSNAGLFRRGQEFQAKESFVQSVEGLEFFVAFIDQMASISRLDLAVTTYEGKSIREAFNDLNQIFMEIIAAQEKSDWVLLADLVEYELAPQLQRWDGIIAMFGSAIAATRV
jgi:hypothetical protein